jgi:carbon storage regulator
MLLLTRRVEQSLRIGDDIEVKVLAIERGQVTLGITAPSHVPVHRHEVYEAIQARNRASSGTGLADLDRAIGPLKKPPDPPKER